MICWTLIFPFNIQLRFTCGQKITLNADHVYFSHICWQIRSFNHQCRPWTRASNFSCGSSRHLRSHLIIGWDTGLTTSRNKVIIKNQNHLIIGTQFSNGHGLSHGHGLNQRVGHWVSNEVGFVGSHGVGHGIDHRVGDRVGHVGVHGVSHGIGQKDRVGLIILILN